MIEVFISYAHEDEELRDQLEVHLAALKREGLVQVWHDRRIPPGGELDHTISEHLEKADIILLLVSPYFIDSDYCFDVETARALERHESGEAVVLPVVLQPCDWQNTPFGKLRATPTDGKPIAKFANVHEAFLTVANDVRRAAEGLGQAASSTRPEIDTASARPEATARSSNLRIKKTFSDRERDAFVDESFEYICRFFESSLVELAERNEEVDFRFRRDGDTGFTAAIYVGGEKRSSCRIWLPGRDMFGGSMAYAASDEGRGQSMNDSMSVEDDGYSLGLRPLGLSYMGRQDRELLTTHGAAEYFWSILVSRLQ